MSTIPVAGQIPNHPGIVAWVNEVAAMTKPAAIRYCDGTDAEWDELVDLLVESGTLIKLNESKQPNSVYARTDPGDVARVEDSTFICSVDEKDAGPTNNWMDPEQMKTIMRPLYEGSMVGRTMYVMPFCICLLYTSDAADE